MDGQFWLWGLLGQGILWPVVCVPNIDLCLQRSWQKLQKSLTSVSSSRSPASNSGNFFSSAAFACASLSSTCTSSRSTWPAVPLQCKEV